MNEGDPPREGHSGLRLAAGAVGLAVTVFLLWWLWRGWEPRALMEWRERVHPLVFFLLMAVLPAFGFPTTPFYLLAGATFGTLEGIAGTLAATVANLALSYWLANSALRPLLLRVLDLAGYRLPPLDHDRDWRFVLLVKLTPAVPSVAKNYLLGLAGVSFGPYLAISTVVAGSYAVALVVLGESLLERDLTGVSLAFAALLALAGVVVWWRRHARGSRSPDGPRAD